MPCNLEFRDLSVSTKSARVSRLILEEQTRRASGVVVGVVCDFWISMQRQRTRIAGRKVAELKIPIGFWWAKPQQ